MQRLTQAGVAKCAARVDWWRCDADEALRCHLLFRKTREGAVKRFAEYDFAEYEGDGLWGKGLPWRVRACS